MAALAADRDTPHKGKPRKMDLKVAASTKIYMGALVAVNAAGFAVPAADTANLEVKGRAEEQVDNSAGANGDKVIPVAIGVFKYTGSGIAQANVGDDATVVDDQTVGLAADTTNDIVAGEIEQVDSDGVWIVVPRAGA